MFHICASTHAADIRRTHQTTLTEVPSDGTNGSSGWCKQESSLYPEFTWCSALHTCTCGIFFHFQESSDSNSPARLHSRPGSFGFNMQIYGNSMVPSLLVLYWNRNSKFKLKISDEAKILRRKCPRKDRHESKIQWLMLKNNPRNKMSHMMKGRFAEGSFGYCYCQSSKDQRALIMKHYFIM